MSATLSATCSGLVIADCVVINVALVLLRESLELVFGKPSNVVCVASTIVMLLELIATDGRVDID